MPPDRIVFWQEAPSPHQAPFIRELAKLLPAGRIIAAFQREPSAQRIAMGWAEANYGLTRIVMSPRGDTVEELLKQDPGLSVHIFSGAVHNAEINAIFWRSLRSSDRRIGILSEARDWRGPKGLARQVHSFWHERRYRERVDFVLAIGGSGFEWYRRCGYNADKVFPFCYVVERNGRPGSRVEPLSGRVELAYVGRLVAGKGVSVLLRAVVQLADLDWRLTIVGDGPDRHRLQRLGARLGLQERVRFTGHLSNYSVREQLENADLLVFPSEIDGWGAVVNEALMAGVPVVCSDWCGAGTLIKPGWNGDVFRSGSVSPLANIMRKWILAGKLSACRREEIRRWSECIGGPAVARYVLAVTSSLSVHNGSRPQPPWLGSS